MFGHARPRGLVVWLCETHRYHVILLSSSAHVIFVHLLYDIYICAKKLNPKYF